MNKEELKSKIKLGSYFISWLAKGICSKEDFEKAIKTLNSLKDEDLVELIRHDETIIVFLKNPSFVVQKFIALNYSFSFCRITNQNPEACKVLIHYFPRRIVDVKNQTIELCLIALNLDNESYKGIKIVPNPDFETTLSNLKKKQLILDSI